MTTWPYWIEVVRRRPTDTGYEHEPFVAVARCADRVVAVQFGSRPGIAFERAWRLVQEEREREPVHVEVPA